MTAFDIAKDWLRYAKSDLNTADHTVFMFVILMN